MNAPVAPAAIQQAEVKLLTPGMPFAGGFFVGTYIHDGQLSALIVAPKEQGDIRGAWNDSDNMVEGAVSYLDGLANTKAMADAGSELAKQVLALDINGFTDWHIPAMDQLEMLYRHLKPTTNENYIYNRSGLNVSASPATYPYTRAIPAQVAAEAFQAGGAEALEDAWHWSSTQHSADSGYAWMQGFGSGTQGCDRKSDEYRCRAVRRLIIQ